MHVWWWLNELQFFKYLRSSPNLKILLESLGGKYFVISRENFDWVVEVNCKKFEVSSLFLYESRTECNLTKFSVISISEEGRNVIYLIKGNTKTQYSNEKI